MLMTRVNSNMFVEEIDYKQDNIIIVIYIFPLSTVENWKADSFTQRIVYAICH